MENKNYTITYEGDLRVQLVHEKSGTVIYSDAPTDNNGKGAAFSPTDLLASSLVSCILTIAGINTNYHLNCAILIISFPTTFLQKIDP